jgi:hypothetical protein
MVYSRLLPAQGLESVQNTVRESNCLKEIATAETQHLFSSIMNITPTAVHFQARCGCCLGKPCYWSSRSVCWHSYTQALSGFPNYAAVCVRTLSHGASTLSNLQCAIHNSCETTDTVCSYCALTTLLLYAYHSCTFVHCNTSNHTTGAHLQQTLTSTAPMRCRE